eukprot:TRINITY_DN7288_c0_g1_i1.p1 TRINITY_DN7288_c0_g1~~TRINITY_DN7288_c0_g1_i1.p1  ORF type:complete len:488 (+),score=106.56 TRINITY_DN7288_c0_g1_i1:1026-2489(+)
MPEPMQGIVAPGVIGKHDDEEEERPAPSVGSSSDRSRGQSWIAPWERTVVAVPVAPSAPSAARGNGDAAASAASMATAAAAVATATMMANADAVAASQALPTAVPSVTPSLPATGSHVCDPTRSRTIGTASATNEDDTPTRSLSFGTSRSSTMDQLVLSRASRIAGFEEGGAPGQQVTREELMEQGVPRQQADAYVVRVHENEVFMQNFHRWILCFSCIMLISMPALVAIFFWACAVYWEDKDKACDVPLQMWSRVMFGIVLFNATVNRPMLHGSCVVRFCCCYTRDPEAPQPTPLRVCIFNAAVLFFVFAWNCLGLHWTAVSGDGHRANTLPSCHVAAPNLLMAVRVYASFHIAFTIFAYVNMIGFAHLLHTAMRMGFLKTNDAAPKGSLEKNTEEIQVGDECLEEQPSCSVCLEDFAPAGGEIRKTILCGHAFHRQCLQGWLNVNRTCPLCRKDLGSSGESPSPHTIVHNEAPASPLEVGTTASA